MVVVKRGAAAPHLHATSEVCQHGQDDVAPCAAPRLVRQLQVLASHVHALVHHYQCMVAHRCEGLNAGVGDSAQQVVPVFYLYEAGT